MAPLLEACYAKATGDQHWGDDLVSAFGEAFPFLDRIFLTVNRFEPLAQTYTPMLLAGAVSILASYAQAAEQWSAHKLRPYLEPHALVSTIGEAERAVDPDVRAYMAEQRRALGIPEGVAIVVHPNPGVSLLMFGVTEVGAVGRSERNRLARIALHVESGFRLRASSGAVRAVMTTEGELVEGDVAQVEREQYAIAARGAETTRTTRDLEPWTALVAGEVSVVPRMRGSRRVYEVVENAREAQPHRALSKREVDVLELAAKGLPVKLCAYALGLSSSAISGALENAARKIGASSRLELLRIAALFARDPRGHADEITLTRAEREILALVREGLSNSEIAARRQRSVRTIANQVASLLGKTGAASRRALIASHGPRPTP